MRLHSLDECLSNVWVGIDRKIFENGRVPLIQRLTRQQAESTRIEKHFGKPLIPAPQRIKKLQERRLPDQIRNVTRRGHLPQSQNRILQQTLRILQPKRPQHIQWCVRIQRHSTLRVLATGLCQLR